MGQTGVGKSSLLKVLFDVNIQADPVRPTTRQVETYTINGDNGHTLIIKDLPGIGESVIADKDYLDMYRQHFRISNIVLWAIHADHRSTTFDVQALHDLLEKLDPQEKSQLMSKMTIVLTKVDTLVTSPWIMAHNNSTVQFSPGTETRKIIEQKQEFFQEQIIKPFGSYIISRTHNDVNFVLDDSSFTYDQDKVTYHGLLTMRHVEELSQKYPRYKSLFLRLYDNYSPIPCSAQLKYNLHQLMLVILNKLGSEAVQSFKQVINHSPLETMSLDQARQLSNLLIWNKADGRKVLDLEEGIFPDRRRDLLFYRKKEQQNGWFSRGNQRKPKRS